MDIKTLFSNLCNMAKIATVIIFLALIRCIIEPFRLQYYATSTLTFVDINPFLIGALVSSLALLIMTILFYFGKHRVIIATSILTVAVLLIVKWIYLLK